MKPPLRENARRLPATFRVVLAVACLAGALRAQLPPATVLDPGVPSLPGVVYTAGPGTVEAGAAVAHAGDVNRDRRPDLLIAAPGGGAAPGRVFLSLAPQRGQQAAVFLEPSEALRAVVTGSAEPDGLGVFVAGAGDVDGDGFDDVLIGADRAHGVWQSGAVYLLFGGSQLPDVTSLGNDLPLRGVALGLPDGTSAAGLTGAGLGDVNGDGFADVGVGLPEHAAERADGAVVVGRVFIIFGGPHWRDGAAERDLATAAGAEGYQLEGVVRDGNLGAALASLGDLDNDGTDDYGIGAPGGAAGRIYIVFGTEQPAAIPALMARDGVAVVLPSTEALGAARFGAAIAGGLDATGDGIPDLVGGAPAMVQDDTTTGGALLLAGGPAVRGGAERLAPLDEATVLVGTRGSLTGAAVALVPDMDGDRVAEVLLGAPRRRGSSGAAYLLPGRGDWARRHFVGDDASILLGHQNGARLGAALAGLADRSGDGRGEIALGAPGVPSPNDAGASGLCFELFAPGNADAQAPRELRARLLPGARVLLTWSPAREYRRLRIYRDGQDVSGPLPGTLQHFVDTTPPAGLRVYEVEADGQPGLRSDPAELLLAPLPVRDVRCRQLDGGTRVRVRWAAADFYAALQVLLDGQPVSPLLPPATQRFELDVTPGLHVIEVIDPVLDPGGARAGCLIDVVAPDLPPIEDFRCAVLGPHRVRLRWTPDPAYAQYVVLRSGVPIADVAGNSFVDSAAPAGEVDYALRGVHRGIYLGPPAACEVVVEESGSPAIRGRVAFADRRGTPIRRGRVRVFSPEGEEVAQAQPQRNGRFVAPVEGPGPFRLVYELRLERDAPTLLSDLPLEPSVLALTRDGVMAGETVDLLLGVPVFVVASEASADVGATALARWRPLRRAVERDFVPGEDVRASVLVVPLSLPQGIARGTLALGAQVGAVGAYLEAQLGSAPDAIDLVAYGAAGLAARVFHASAPEPFVRKLVLLGTPNLGTPRSGPETRGELAGRPLRLDALAAGRFAGFLDPALDNVYFAAAEQSAAFLAELNARLRTRRGTEVHLVAGTGGRVLLDPILGCDEHDDRVCLVSAHGGIPGAALHTVVERHGELGRGPESVPLLLEILGVFAPLVPVDRGEVAPLEEAAGGGAGVVSSSYPGPFYSGVLQPGAAVELLMVSDTSDSIIVVLNSKLPGGIEFRVERPDGGIVDPAAAGALPAVTYFSYGDGEGHEIQAYEFRPSEVGTYVALLENSGTDEIEYTLEMYLESDITLAAALTPETIGIQDDATLEASLQLAGAPIPDGVVEATVWRPDGAVEVLALLDDGAGRDQEAGDGIYTGRVTTDAQPGVHAVAVTATHGEQAGPPFSREVALQLRVQSDVAQLADGLTSGTLDTGTDGLFETLWLHGEITTTMPGTFWVAAELSGAGGGIVATASALVSASEAGLWSYQLDFDGFDIYAGGEDGPYVVSMLELFDGSVGLVLADQQADAHVTEFFEWNQFGLSPGTPYVRGDTNADTEHDISDAIAILEHLFTGGVGIDCEDAADTNADGFVDVTDASYLLNFLFLGGVAPEAPFPACAALSLLGCEEFPVCSDG